MKRTWLGMIALLLCLTGCGARTETGDSLADPQYTIDVTKEQATVDTTQETTTEAVLTKRVPIKIQNGYVTQDGELLKRPAATLEYNEQGELVTIHNYDKLNRINSDWMALEEPSYGDDMNFVFENGQLVKMTVTNYDSLEATYDIVYDEAGKKKEATWKMRNNTCYVGYVYDEESGLLREKQYRSGDEKIDSSCTYNYDEAGVLQEKVLVSYLVKWEHVRDHFSYHYDENGRLSQLDWKRYEADYGRLEWDYTVLYEYDEEGMILKERVEKNLLDGSGEIDWSDDQAVLELYYEYAEIVVKEKSDEDKTPSGEGTNETPTQDAFVDGGVLLYYTMETEDRMGNLHFVEPPYSPMYEYDKEGRLIGIKNAGLSPEIIDLTIADIGGDAVFSYDDQGRLSHVDLANGRVKVDVFYTDRGLRMCDYIVTDRLSYEVSYTYDDGIDYLFSRHYCPDGYNFYRELFLYDSHGAVIEKTVEHHNGNIWVQTNTTTMEYDKEGRLIRENEQIQGMQIQYTGSIITEYTYNEHGDLIMKEVRETPIVYPDGREEYPNHIRTTYRYVYGEVNQ